MLSDIRVIYFCGEKVGLFHFIAMDRVWGLRVVGFARMCHKYLNLNAHILHSTLKFKGKGVSNSKCCLLLRLC